MVMKGVHTLIQCRTRGQKDLIERGLLPLLSEDNYIRHLPVESFRVQNRGGKGLKGVTTKAEDTPQLIITCFSKDNY